ncbi:hypothetical protein FAZ19_14550 [Sphingobacterium alkalisoli]|uniref:Uncharacterized protein n=1 Tax=Sphingobacterium alkalisoli TaxID=1874115 RepID=A0A4U0GZ76_9SPHI|nr:hypothetical protein [Sphingobacterium alkalisoli]TJY64418.1 hypothetical protein FAZ19_14550 [Sphingobacterium alkalisoli]GGH21876.1 hypothetical protein GCM10011418_28040 [Sphingobacterium alkalisoli]
MKSQLLMLYRLSFIFIAFFVASCSDEVPFDELSEDLYTVNFTIDGFAATRSPIKNSIGQAKKLADNNPSRTSTDTDGYLYFWSFNNESLNPDIIIAGGGSATITYNSGSVPSNFVNSTYANESYAAGKALSVTGGRELYIKMPTQLATSVTSFGLDIGSTDTGPKDFELYYSLDDGETYETLALINQFGSLSNNAKNSFVYDLRDKNISSSSLLLKFVFKAGERGNAGDYGSTGGTFRVDNIYMKGVSESISGHTLKKLHYNIFHRDKNEIVYSGVVDYEDNTDIQVQLPLGKYYVCFVSNASKQELLMPTDPLWKSFYVSNKFSNHEAEIFGYSSELEVNADVQLNVELRRWYSQVKFEFTDPIDLSRVKRIRVSQEHEPLFFSPFVTDLSNPILDQSDIDLNIDDLSANKQILFHQFLGNLNDLTSISYKLEVFNESNELMRSFIVNSTLKNNMQLVFRGELLKDLPQSLGFTVTKNENWGDNKEENF